MPSSLVGTNISAPRPSIELHLSLYNFSIMGTKYESVFPDPVLAHATKSLPAREWGIVTLWVSVIFENPAFESPQIVALEIGKSENLIFIFFLSFVSITFLLCPMVLVVSIILSD